MNTTEPTAVILPPAQSLEISTANQSTSPPVSATEANADPYISAINDLHSRLLAAEAMLKKVWSALGIVHPKTHNPDA